MPIKKISPIYRPPPPKPRPPPSTEVRAPQSGQTIASRIIKPVGAAVVLWAAFAQGQTSVSAPQGGQGACPFPGCKTLGAAVLIDTSLPPYNVVGNFSGTTNTGTDNAPAINRAITQACTMGATSGFPPEVRLPAGRLRVASTIALTCSRLHLSGAGKGATELDGLSTSTAGCGQGFSVIANRLNGGRTCKTSGAGACDAPINAATRGIGCPCYQNADCASGSCTGGTSINNVLIENLSVSMKNDCSVGIDLWGISESVVRNVQVAAGVSPFSTGINSFNVLFSDSIGQVAAYSNLVMGSTFTGGTDASNITIDVESAGNDQRLVADTIKAGQIGVKCSKVGANTSNVLRIVDSLIQSTATSAIEDHCGGTQITNDLFEGATAGISITSDAQRATLRDLYFDASVTTPITNAGTNTTLEGLPPAATAPVTCTTAGGAGTGAGA